jgi:hypothetical protein
VDAATERLAERFWRMVSEEGIDLAGFCDLARSGAFGDVTVDALVSLVDAVTQTILGNIDLKASEGMFWQERAEGRRAEVMAERDRLVAGLRDGRAPTQDGPFEPDARLG